MHSILLSSNEIFTYNFFTKKQEKECENHFDLVNRDQTFVKFMCKKFYTFFNKIYTYIFPRI